MSDRTDAELSEWERLAELATAQKYQPAGSPPPGDGSVLLGWILSELQAENARLREWLDTIRGIAYHYDGYETADDLKALIDELYEDAGKALAGESVKYIDLNTGETVELL